MKKQKKYIALFIGVVMLISNTALAADRSSGAELVKAKIQEIEASKQASTPSEEFAKASAEFDNLMNNMDFEEGYPSYYGGAYLTDDDDLVILLTDQSPEVALTIKEAVENTSVTIQYVDVSLNYLEALQMNYGNCYLHLYEQKDVEERFSDTEKGLLDDLKGTYIDQSCNQLVVQIRNMTAEKVRIHKTLFG